MKDILLAFIIATAPPQLTDEQKQLCLLTGKLAYDIQLARQESSDKYYLMRHKIMLDLPEGDFKILVEKILVGVFSFFPDENTNATMIHERVLDGCINSHIRDNATKVTA